MIPINTNTEDYELKAVTDTGREILEQAINRLSDSQMSPRHLVLAEAINACLADRNKAYGAAEDNFDNIAVLFNGYINAKIGLILNVITPADVASLMVLVKVARLSTNPGHKDSWVDIAGYAACGFQAFEIEPEKVRKAKAMITPKPPEVPKDSNPVEEKGN